MGLVHDKKAKTQVKEEIKVIKIAVLSDLEIIHSGLKLPLHRDLEACSNNC